MSENFNRRIISKYTKESYKKFMVDICKRYKSRFKYLYEAI